MRTIPSFPNAKFNRLLLALLVLLPQTASTQNTNTARGTVVSWGSQVIPYVAPGTRFTKIAAGGSHSLALKSDGTVVAWGANWNGQSTVPGGLNGVVAIAARDHSLALNSDGTVVGWGGVGPKQRSKRVEWGYRDRRRKGSQSGTQI